MGSALDRYYAEKKKKVTNNNTPNGSALDRYYKQQSYNSIDTTGVDQKYIDSFINDAKTFLATAEKDYGGIGWANASSSYDSTNAYWQDLNTRADTIDAWLYKNKKNLDSETYKSLSDSIGSIRSSASSVLDSFKGVRDYYSQWETEDDYNSWYEHMKNLEADDFEEYSQKGASIENPTYAQANGSDNFLGWKNPFKEGAEINNIVTFSRDNIDDIEKAIAGSDSNADLGSVLGDRRYKFLTDDEVSVYNYYLGKGDNEKAEEYLKSLDDTLNKRWAGDIAEGIDDNVFLEALLGVSAGIETSIQGFKGLADFVLGNESGTNYSATQYADQLVASNNNGFIRGVHDVSSAIGGMAPSILVGSLTGGLGGALTMGASATGNAYNEMIDLGYNQWQARGYGLLVGASEAALSYALGGISKLGGKVSNHVISNLVSKVDNAIARTAIQLGGNMASEGLEEAIQTVLEPAFKALMTGETFEAPEWEEVWYSALLGALTAGVLEGVPTIANTAISSHQANKIYGADASALVGESLEIDPDNAHAQRMQARLDNNKNVSGYQLNRLVQANEQTLYNQDVAKMKSAVEARLTEVGETGDISKLADVIVKAQSGEKLTRSERSVLVNSKYGRRVSTELNPKSIDSGEYSSAWAENIGTERINSEAYNKDLYDLASEQTGVAVAEEEASVTENPTAKEIATEAKFEASTDGKTRIGDLEVSIKEIASVKNGEVTLRLEDDSTVSARDVEYGSSAEALLYENVADMNLNAATANAFIKGYDPNTMSADQYAKGFREAYNYGKYNFPVNEMSKKGFSDMLSESQRNLAYNLGKTDAKYDIDAKSAKIAEKIASTSAKNVGKDSQKASKKGKLHNTIAPSTERQKASLKALGVLAETLGIDIYTFESPVVNGKRQGANGWFDPKDGSIHIDLHAGMSGEGTMLFTAAHELTHFIREWSPAKFKVFADFLLEQYGKKGVSVKALVAEQIEKARRNGRTIDYDTAYEEVIADSCEAMLADGDVIAKIAELKAKDKSLWQKIKDFFDKLVARIKDAYKGMKPDSYEGRKVAEMLDTAEKLKALWTEALVDASDSYNQSDFVEINTESESVSPMLSERTWTASEYVTHRDQMAEKIAKAIGVSKAKAKSYIDDINSIAKMIAEDRVRLDYEASSFGSAFVSNVEYGGIFDYTTLCKKRRIYTGTFTEIQKRLKDVALTPDDILAIRNLMIEEGIEATCGLCYVEGSRANMGKFAKEFIRLYKRDNPLAWIPNMADVNTPDGVEQMRISHPEAYDQYVYFWNHYGKLQNSDPALFASQQKPKLYEARKEYKGEILEHFGDGSSVDKKNRNGGIRMQSFSDFEIVHLIDTMQVIMDMSTVGLAGQAYTKVPEFAKAFGSTGLKINLSLIAKGVDADGNLIFDDREGMPHKTAFDLRNRYSKNVGTIIVTFTDEQLLAAMADPRIDFIIPFHRSQWKKGQYGAMGLPKGTKDYTYMQNEKLIKKTYHEYRGRMVLDKASNYMPNEYWDFSKSGKENAEAYLKMCAENNKRPKFYKLLDYDGKGTYSLKKDGSTDGYWKLLIDFKMYDNDGVGSPQNAVTPTFNMDEAKTMLDEYQGGHSKYPVASSVVDTFVEKYNKDHGTKYSDRDSQKESYAPTFYSHMGNVVDGIKSEKVGANGVVSYLKGKGVKNEEIKWSGIEAFLEGKKSVTKAELQEFVSGSQLQIVEQMSGEDIDLRYDGSNRAYTLHDSNGEVIDTFTYNSFLDGYVADSDEEIYSDPIELREALREAYGNTAAPRWEDYKIDGGSNYRELVFQLPNSSYSNNAMRVHWGEDAEGVLAHARVQDFIVNGKKMLFIEEIQSDWHNEGHQKGYTSKEYEDAVATADKRIFEYNEIGRAWSKYIASNEFDTDSAEVRKEKYEKHRHEEDTAMWRKIDAEKKVDDLKKKGAGDTPDAPFRDTYHEYVLKRLLRMAAEEGYDSIGWTPSWIQGLRWSEDYSEGYRIEYDQDIPSFLKKYGKKWGAKVGETSLNDGKEDFNVWSMDIPTSMKDSVLHEGQVLYSDRNTASFNGKPFWSGSVSLLDGVIEEVHSMEEAEAVDFHHTMYFSQAQVEKMDSGENAFFWVDNGTVQGNWRESVPKSIIKKIEEQITISPSVVEAREFSDADIKYSIREEAPPKKTKEGYKVFVVKNGKLYPPMVANPNAEDTPVGVWLNADVGARAPDSKTGRAQVKAGGKGTQGGSGSLAFRPGWHLGETPLATQFDRTNPETGVKELFPENFVWALCDIAADHDYQEEAMSYGYTKNGKFQHSLAGLPKLPTDGYYKYRTNPNPETVPWLITGAMKVKKLLSDAEVNAILTEKGLAPKHRVGGEKTLADLGLSQYDGKLFSDRDTDSVSNRSLLANALESVAQNDIERKKLEEYKGKIALIESEQAKLEEVKKKANDIRFTKGRTAEETKRMKDLEFEANQIANRINTYDKQLLNLESTKALKGVLEREKKMAYKKAEQRGKEALEAYRERATKTQRELMDRYQESRKKGVESRNMTAMRHKIKDVVKELNDYLLKGTKDKHVPIQLQKAVAEALDAVNMDTVGAEERIAKKRAEMIRAKSPEVIEKLAKEIEHIQEMGGNMEAKLSRLKTSYDSIINSDDPLVANSHDDVISNTIDKVIEVVGDTPLRDMSLYQLEAVYDMYRMILHSIRSANKAFKAEKGKEISVLANEIIAFLDGKKRNPLNPIDTKFAWNNLKPVYAFERIGSNTFTKLFNAVRAGEDVWARDMSEAQAFREEQSKKHKYDSFDFEKKYTFQTNRGTPFELNLGEMMSIYAFAKDEHSKGHLIGEGFVFDPKKEVVENVKGKINVKVNLEDATAYNLSEAVVEKITQTLSEIPGAKDFVDAMQDYLSTTMGEKGNEVSLELYQVKLFKNKNYFPLKVAPQYMAIAKEKAQGDVKIKNKGFTKDRKEGAKNPIVLSSFMDVWASHVNEMSMYHAFTLPLEDFYRVFNYKTPNMEGYAPMSVNASLENAYGTAATSYIEQLLKDLNGGARVDPTAGVINKLTGLFKKSAVFGSLSVVVQQPSAIARATALVDSKYFVGKSSGKHKEVWAEVKKYAPVAVIKEMGYFDTGMGQSSVEWLKGDKTWKDKVDDALSKAPALADEYSWCAIWNAVKRETLHTHKDLKPNSEEFLNAVGERFTEVITKTQVYDSVLSRSANMRSKDTGMKMATAFMGEPTTSINMLQDALTQGKRGNKRYARKAVGGVVASMILNSILVSLVYAGRDDDEEKTYAEKYVGTLTEELIDSVNPLTLIPFVKDVVSIVQGYDVERSDMAVITDVINAWNNLDSDNRSAYRKVEDFAGAIASIFGLPVKNIMRDARGMYNTVNSFVNGEKTTGAGIGSAVKEAVTGKAESNGQQLYDAILSGDTAQIERVKGRFKDQKAIDSAIRTALRENDSRIKEAAEARYNGDIAGYMRIAKEIIAEGYFSQDDIVSAINSEITALKKGEGTTSASTSSNKVESIYEVADYYSALEGRDQATAYAVKEDIIKVSIANGKDRDEAEADFNSKFASHLRDLYEVGGISDFEARNMLINYGGKSEEQAYSKVQYWAFKKKYPDYDLTEDAVTKYYNEVEHSGISIDVYYDYYKQRSKCKGADSDGDGKTDSGSVKSEVLYVINSLPITNAQKDALYYLNGWAASTIWQAPWH